MLVKMYLNKLTSIDLGTMKKEVLLPKKYVMSYFFNVQNDLPLQGIWKLVYCLNQIVFINIQGGFAWKCRFSLSNAW